MQTRTGQIEGKHCVSHNKFSITLQIPECITMAIVPLGDDSSPALIHEPPIEGLLQEPLIEWGISCLALLDLSDKLLRNVFLSRISRWKEQDRHI